MTISPVAPIVQFFCDRVKNIAGKGENTGYKHFYFSNAVFQRLPSQGCQNQGLFGKGLKMIS